MPNGGSDCCGTCWHNRVNEGKSGYERPGEAKGVKDYCEIRGIAIESAFYTYCANHPHRMPDGGEFPIGPIYMGDSNGNRGVWVPSPDTEGIRLNLLHVLENLELVAARDSYPIGMNIGSVVMQQLVQFREQRAVPILQRLSERWPKADLFKEALQQIKNT